MTYCTSCFQSVFMQNNHLI